MTRTVLVCGGRTYSDWYGLCAILDAEHARDPIGLLIHGAAPGVEQLAESWAGTRGVPIRRFVAMWQAHGPAAGPIRNRRMLVEGKPDESFVPFVLSSRYAKGDLIRHPKFGKGMVIAAEPTRIEVLFQDGKKKLGHAVA